MSPTRWPLYISTTSALQGFIVERKSNDVPRGSNDYYKELEAFHSRAWLYEERVMLRDDAMTASSEEPSVNSRSAQEPQPTHRSRGQAPARRFGVSDRLQTLNSSHPSPIAVARDVGSSDRSAGTSARDLDPPPRPAGKRRLPPSSEDVSRKRVRREPLVRSAGDDGAEEDMPSIAQPNDGDDSKSRNVSRPSAHEGQASFEVSLIPTRVVSVAAVASAPGIDSLPVISNSPDRPSGRPRQRRRRRRRAGPMRFREPSPPQDEASYAHSLRLVRQFAQDLADALPVQAHQPYGMPYGQPYCPPPQGTGQPPYPGRLQDPTYPHGYNYYYNQGPMYGPSAYGPPAYGQHGYGQPRYDPPAHDQGWPRN